MNFTAKCKTNGHDSVSVSPLGDGAGSLRINILYQNNPRAYVSVDKKESLRLASEIFAYHGVKVPEYKSYAVFAIPFFPVQKKFIMIIRKDGKLGFPGGKVEDGESSLYALVREVKEEVGFTSTNGEYTYLREDHIRDTMYSQCYLWEYHCGSVTPEDYMSGFDKASHREESIGYLICDANHDTIDKIIDKHQLASTVREELIHFKKMLAK